MEDTREPGRKSVEAIMIKLEVAKLHVYGRNRRKALLFAVCFIMLVNKRNQ